MGYRGISWWNLMIWGAIAWVVSVFGSWRCFWSLLCLICITLLRDCLWKGQWMIIYCGDIEPPIHVGIHFDYRSLTTEQNYKKYSMWVLLISHYAFSRFYCLSMWEGGLRHFIIEMIVRLSFDFLWISIWYMQEYWLRMLYWMSFPMSWKGG